METVLLLGLVVTGTSAADVLYGGSGDDSISGGSGDDWLLGYAGNDTLDGGSDFDLASYISASSGVTVDLASGIATGGYGDDVLISIEKVWGSDFGDSLTGDFNNNTLYGDGGNDTVYGAAGNDTLIGDDGNDILDGGSENDSILGGAGDDFLDGGAGADTLDGGAGVDFASYLFASSGVTVNLQSGLAAGGASGDVLISIENLDGSSDADFLTGDSQNNRFSGFGGNDSMVGGLGNDYLSGGTDNDTLHGGSGADTLVGGSGGDTMEGGDGNDTYYIDNVGDVVTESSNSIDGTTDTLVSTVTRTLGGYQENLILSGTDNISGFGNNLNNELTGNDRNNALNGGAGADTMAGGLGDDTYYVANVGDVVVESTDTLDGGLDTVRSSVSRTLGAYQEILILFGPNSINGTGNELNNKLVGNDANNELNGGSGADTMAGGLGNDTYYVDNIADFVNESGDSINGGTDTVRSSIARTLGAYQENLILIGPDSIDGVGNSLSNILSGNNANNVLSGSTGNDTLLGANGNDTLIGGVGVDQLTGGANRDVFDFNALSEMGTDASTRDVITDFTTGFDKIDLSALDANTDTAGNAAFSGALVASFTAAGQLMLVGDVLYGNTDADTDAEFSIQLLGITTLSAADFVL